MYKYIIYGLKVASEFPLSGYEYTGDDIDVAIIEDNIEEYINCTELEKQMNIVLTIPSIAKFCIQNGQRIVIEREKDSKSVDVNLFLLGSAFGMLMYQRNIYCLHGSSLLANDKSVVIVGDSGAGKSSFMAGMSSLDYKIMTDDVTRIIENEDISACSSYPTQKLWKNVAEQFNISLNQAQELSYREDKFVVADVSRFINTAAKIEVLIELVPYNGGEVYLERLQNNEALKTIIQHSYRPEFIEYAGDIKIHFETMAKIAKQVDVYRLYRPLQGMTVSKQNELVIKQILEN